MTLAWRAAAKLFVRAALAVALCSTAVFAADDSAIADFYRGRTITIVVGSDAGGGYDLTARTLSRHIGKYIPGNPTIIVQNKPGASSLAAANYVYEAAPADGTVIAAVQRPVPFQFLFGSAGMRFDLRTLQWLGSTAKEPGVFVSWESAPQRSIKDLLGAEMVVGGNGPSTDTELFARLMNNIFGTKLRIVSGYPGQNEIILAMQRGEVQGGAEGRALHPRCRAQSRRALPAETADAEQGAGPAVLPCAQGAGRTRRGPARCLRRHDAGPGFPRRCSQDRGTD